MDFYENENSYKKRGIGWDLHSAYTHNLEDFEFSLNDIKQVLAVFEGENDESH